MDFGVILRNFHHMAGDPASVHTRKATTLTATVPDATFPGLNGPRLHYIRLLWQYSSQTLKQ